MHRILVLLVVVAAACSASTDVDGGPEMGVDAGHEMSVDSGPEMIVDTGPYDAGPCPMSFWAMRPPFDRSCSVDADCALGIYFAGCCGPTGTGINVSQVTAFNTAVAACNAIPHTDCGCVDVVTADDGTMSSRFGTIGLMVSCRDHLCQTTFRGSTPCGPTVCSPGVSCGAVCDDGGVVPAACISLPLDCAPATSRCDCFTSARVAPCGSGTCADLPDGGYTCTCS